MVSKRASTGFVAQKARSVIGMASADVRREDALDHVVGRVVLAGDAIDAACRSGERGSRAARPLELGAVGQRARAGAVLLDAPVVDAAVAQVRRVLQGAVPGQGDGEAVAQRAVCGDAAGVEKADVGHGLRAGEGVAAGKPHRRGAVHDAVPVVALVVDQAGAARHACAETQACVPAGDDPAAKPAARRLVAQDRHVVGARAAGLRAELHAVAEAVHQRVDR
ncbi:MAG: hypothetical protein ACK5QX_07300, partial [bacterium]